MRDFIFAFSRSRTDVFSKLADNSENVIDHLIKVFLWPDVQKQAKWKSEIWNFIKSVPKLKSSNRFPSSKQIKKEIWNSYEDVIYEHIGLWIDEISEEPILFDYKDVYNAIEEYMAWLANTLSEKGVVRSSEVYSKIEDLRSKYFKNQED